MSRWVTRPSAWSARSSARPPPAGWSCVTPSDPPINGALPTSPVQPDMQAHWAVFYYEQYGYWTSVNSAIATWALIAGDQP